MKSFFLDERADHAPLQIHKTTRSILEALGWKEATALRDAQLVVTHDPAEAIRSAELENRTSILLWDGKTKTKSNPEGMYTINTGQGDYTTALQSLLADLAAPAA